MPNQLKNHLRWKNLPIRILKAKHGPAQNNSLHSHDDFYELVLVEQGKGFHRINKQNIPIEAGNIFCIPPGIPHNYNSNTIFTIYNVLIGKPFLDYFQHDLSGTDIYHLFFGMPYRHKNHFECVHLTNQHFLQCILILEEIIQEEQLNHPGSRTAVLSNCMQLILLICRNGKIRSDDRVSMNICQISRVLASLDEHFEKTWNLESMAKYAHTSISSFRQQFLAITGESPIQYLLHLRLNKARALLQLEQQNISEISRACGFASSNYFSRQFKRFFGFSPHYRK
ncbi:MAG: helix-turn-helix domain-containing protein [Lentisphaeria bacterium]